MPAPPPLPRQIRKVGAPVGVLIAFGAVTGVLVLLMTATNPVGTTIGFVLSTLGIGVVVLAYLWLDRWEPEPPRLLLMAFGWGTSVAVVVSLVLELVLGAAITPHEKGPGFATVAVLAPVVEEAAKGMFLLIMMTGRRRRQLNSLTDCLVYAGITAAGFAWMEDIVYIAEGKTVAMSVVTAAMRLVMGPFAHPLFTTMTGLGVYFALRQRSAGAKFGCILLGYCGAVVMHGLWNGSSLLGAKAYLLVYVLWMVPIFGVAITLGVVSRRREQRVVAGKLPGMMAANLVTPNEATWLGSMRHRKVALGEARRLGGPAAVKSVQRFAAQVVELAFVRDRIERGFGDQAAFAEQTEEAYGVVAARAAAPVLYAMAGYRSPLPPPRPS